jgi:GNAT superfamily N-acetyltransferase
MILIHQKREYPLVGRPFKGMCSKCPPYRRVDQNVGHTYFHVVAVFLWEQGFAPGPDRHRGWSDRVHSTYFKRFRMQADLAALPGATSLPAGYRFVSWNEAVIDVHARTKFRAFRDELDAIVFPCLGDLEGCRRLMREIRRKSGFLPAATWLIAFGSTPESIQWCGTIQGVAEQGGIGMIQNVGVVPGHRGLGLGRNLVERAMAGFRMHGLPRVSLEVTVDNTRAVRLYQRLGFRRRRTVYKVVEAASAEPALV